MWRCTGIGSLAILLATVLGCPQPISDDGTGPAAAGGAAGGQVKQAGRELMTEDAEHAVGLTPPETDSGEELDGVEAPAEDGAVTEPTASGAEDEAATVEEEAEAAAPADSEGPQAEAQAGPGGDEEDFDRWDPQAALDPDRILTETPAAASERPMPSVTAEAASFAGQWQVVVLNKDGRAVLTETHNAWQFWLQEDGSCTVQQHANGEIWEQDGTWELADDRLTLMLGPAGHRAYRVEQFSDDFAVLADQVTGAALFTLRIAVGVAAPRVKNRYETDFGELQLNASGQAYWRGSYGEPEGELLLRKEGASLVGTWEQGADKGFVVFELAAGGFNGWWWYEASTTVDGTWRGRAGD